MTGKHLIQSLCITAAAALALVAGTADAASGPRRTAAPQPPSAGSAAQFALVAARFKNANDNYDRTRPAPAVGPQTIATGPSVAMKMRDEILGALSGKAVGFAFALVKNGQLAIAEGVGAARTAGDNYQPMTPSSRLNVMSVTKTTTAVAVIQLLQKNGLSVDSPVAPWLPPEWVKGAGFVVPQAVTFRQLLDHTSGLGQLYSQLDDFEQANWGNDWDGLEFVVSNGAQPGSAYSYKNANYALLRVAIPYLWKATGNHPGIGVISEINVGIWYLAYVQQQVFVPSGVQSVTCTVPNAATATLVYNASNPGAGGKLVQTPAGELDGCGGHANLQLSALDLARFMAYLTHGKLLNAAGTQLMDSGRLGWNTGSNTPGEEGIYWHGGDGYWTNGGVKREVHACVMKFPGDLQATLVINSSNLSGTSQCGTLLNAYRAATAG